MVIVKGIFGAEMEFVEFVNNEFIIVNDIISTQLRRSKKWSTKKRWL